MCEREPGDGPAGGLLDNTIGILSDNPSSRDPDLFGTGQKAVEHSQEGSFGMS